MSRHPCRIFYFLRLEYFIPIQDAHAAYRPFETNTVLFLKCSHPLHFLNLNWLVQTGYKHRHRFYSYVMCSPIQRHF
jgi:hypothetical protein